MKITDFKFGDRIKRKRWDKYKELTPTFNYDFDLGMTELLADDWEKEPKKIKKEGWIGISPNKESLGNKHLIGIFEDFDQAEIYLGNYIPAKIEWEEEE